MQRSQFLPSPSLPSSSGTEFLPRAAPEGTGQHRAGAGSSSGAGDSPTLSPGRVPPASAETVPRALTHPPPLQGAGSGPSPSLGPPDRQDCCDLFPSQHPKGPEGGSGGVSVIRRCFSAVSVPFSHQRSILGTSIEAMGRAGWVRVASCWCQCQAAFGMRGQELPGHPREVPAPWGAPLPST